VHRERQVQQLLADLLLQVDVQARDQPVGHVVATEPGQRHENDQEESSEQDLLEVLAHVPLELRPVGLARLRILVGSAELLEGILGRGRQHDVVHQGLQERRSAHDAAAVEQGEADGEDQATEVRSREPEQPPQILDIGSVARRSVVAHRGPLRRPS
jgi:hypothetical protein